MGLNVMEAVLKEIVGGSEDGVKSTLKAFIDLVSEVERNVEDVILVHALLRCSVWGIQYSFPDVEFLV